jgi:hypothetical protein
LETFFPGILIPNHQSNTKTATTAMVTRSALKKIFERVAECTSGISLTMGPIAEPSEGASGGGGLPDYPKFTRAFSENAERTD